MKTIKYLSLLSFPIFFLFLTSFVDIEDIEDCEDEDFLDECAEVIDGYKFLKANLITIDDESKIEYKSVFSKGSTYMLTACNIGEGALKVTLYDRNKKRVMSNFIRSKYYPSVIYPCTATGVYYLKYEFTAGNGCGVGIIGFKK